jgi:putative DNA primase/helicase
MTIRASDIPWSQDHQPSPLRPPGHLLDQAEPVIVRLADVQPEPIDWLWPGRLAAGKLSALIGDPGLGKSFVTLDCAARMTRGHAWPDGAVGATAGPVLLLSAEDGLADTIRPRLDALEADVKLVHHLAVLRTGDKERAVRLTDVAPLEQAITKTSARLVVIDPISAYLGKTDSHKDAEVRGLLAPLAALAEKTSVAILVVMHLAKSTQAPAIYRAVGSIAFAAAARVVLAVAADPDRDGRRILAPVKNNLAAAPAALAYSLADGRLVWELDPVSDVDINALLAGPGVDGQERREADAWLRALLADAGGRMLSREIQREGEQAGFSWKTLVRASWRLNIEHDRVGGLASGGKWYWSLPAPKVATKVATENEVANLGADPGNAADFSGVSPKLATLNDVANLGGQDSKDENKGGLF